MERDLSQVEHRQDVGVADLVLEREADHVELVQRSESLQAVERQPVLAQGGLEVGQRREDALAGPVVGVHQAVEDLQPVVAHPQGVGVGKSQANRAPHVRWSLTMLFSSPPTYCAGVRTLGKIREMMASLRS